ncbi:MAG: hypothetical protein D6731_10585 [Planctomycetota bacterium]|nr:MAG: hypothetical protein D6731_10585 [Planctomycetota bacterium]
MLRPPGAPVQRMRHASRPSLPAKDPDRRDGNARNAFPPRRSASLRRTTGPPSLQGTPFGRRTGAGASRQDALRPARNADASAPVNARPRVRTGRFQTLARRVLGKWATRLRFPPALHSTRSEFPMIPTIRTAFLVAAGLAVSSPALAGPPEIGISSLDVEEVRYLAPTIVQRTQAKRLEEALGDRLEGKARLRRVRLIYEEDESGRRFPVRGFLYGWRNLVIERYLMADLDEAVAFFDHDREEPNALSFVEARGRQVLVVTGKDADDGALVARVRELAWPRSVGKRVDAIGLQESEENFYYAVSSQAFAANPQLVALFDEAREGLEILASFDVNAKVSKEGDVRRVAYTNGILTAGPHSMARYSDEDGEKRVTDLLSLVGPLPAGVSLPGTASSSGLSGALGGATSGGNSSAPDAVALGPNDEGRTVRIARGGELVVELPGNPSTGYRWEVKKSPRKLELVDEEFDGPGAGGPVGAGGKFRFVFRARRKGSETLTLVYRRPWESEAAETFRAKVVVE